MLSLSRIRGSRKPTGLLKSTVLRHLPGQSGQRYERRYRRLRATQEFHVAVQQSRNKACIDLGANVGKYTKFMAEYAKHVFAFEPDPWAFTALEANVGHLKNVTAINAAAGTCDAEVCLYRHSRFEDDPAKFSTSSSILAEKNDVASNSAIVTRQVNFVRYLEKLNDGVCVLKIDIEGAEIDLLEALLGRADLLDRIDHIFAETHESRIPDHQARVSQLRQMAQQISRPDINLYWG